MERKYTLKSGKEITCWYSDMGHITVMDDQGMDKQRFEFDYRDTDPTFEYMGEVIHIHDFNFIPLDDLIEQVNEGVRKHDRWAVRECDALATIMKEHDKVGFIMEVDCYDTLIPGFGFAMKSSSSARVKALMVPFEDQWKIKDWHYKIDLRPHDPGTRQIVGRETMYFSDLWSSIMHGKFIQIVNIEKYNDEDKVVKEGTIHTMNLFS